MLPDFYVGNYSFPNEVLYEGNITDFFGEDIVVRRIRNCCIYDISYQTAENTDHIEQAMLFTIEVFCDVYYKNQQDVRTIARKIHAEKRLLIPQNTIRKQINQATDHHFFIQHMNNITFYSQSLKNRVVYLTVTANIEGIILNEPHEDFWVCSQINMAPPSEDKVQDWKQLLNSINIKDTVSLFENLLLLVKGVCGDELNSSSIKADKKKLEQENMNLTNEINELKNRINDLRSEISSRNYIINGLLKIIRPL